MKIFSLFFAFAITIHFSIAQENPTANFPDPYFGSYMGILEAHSDNGINKYPMEFHLKPTDTLGIYDYIIVYGKGEKRQERKYTLKEKDTEKGIYTLDENNGILLECKVIGNKIYFLFEVTNSLLTTFITFHDKNLEFEIIATNTTQKMVSGGQNEEIPEVFSYPINVVQKAILIKQ